MGDGPAHDGPSQADGSDGGDAAGCTAPTSLDCSGTCVDPTLPSHCGTCSNVCHGPDGGEGAATCTAGTCGLGCSGTTSLNCNGSCVDPTDPAHCGSCTNVCPGPSTGTGQAQCTVGTDGGGTCSVECSGTTTEVCSGACYAPTDPNHCGSCSNACPAPPSGNGQAACPTPPTCGVTCTTGTAHVCANDCLLNTDEPSDTSDPCIINEAFGIFVSPTGSDSAAGTQLAPVATVGHAMDLAKAAGKRVYACGSAGNYVAENLAVGTSRDGVKAFGGLDCTTTPSQWVYNASDKATMAPASGYALQVLGVTTGVTFEDFGFSAANATGVGASSIAVFASNASGVVLERCNVQTGAGTAGQSQNQAAPAAAAPPGSPGNPPTA
ncbi:MAG: hypothetical protein ACRELB_17935 [Polyangiaceae bacterium]